MVNAHTRTHKHTNTHRKLFSTDLQILTEIQLVYIRGGHHWYLNVAQLFLTFLQLSCFTHPVCVCVLQLEEDELRGVALLVFANKQDLPRAMSVSDITEALCLSGVSQPVGVHGTHTSFAFNHTIQSAKFDQALFFKWKSCTVVTRNVQKFTVLSVFFPAILGLNLIQHCSWANVFVPLCVRAVVCPGVLCRQRYGSGRGSGLALKPDHEKQLTLMWRSDVLPYFGSCWIFRHTRQSLNEPENPGKAWRICPARPASFWKPWFTHRAIFISFYLNQIDQFRFLIHQTAILLL